jgi:hypothetical protein
MTISASLGFAAGILAVSLDMGFSVGTDVLAILALLQQVCYERCRLDVVSEELMSRFSHRYTQLAKLMTAPVVDFVGMELRPRHPFLPRLTLLISRAIH